MDVSLEEGQVRRAYDFYSPVYDFLFKKIFEPGRIAGVRMIGAGLKGRVLEVGIGTGLNLPLYPRDIDLVGIDLSEGMLRKAQEKIQELRMGSVTLKVMDASAIALARDNGLPIIVFSLDEPNGLAGIVQGRGRFTIVEPG